MVKGILKRHSSDSVASSCSQSSSTDESPKQKRVSFDGTGPTRVFEADEWDRSPAAVTLKLTYKDVVELRELNVCVVHTGPLTMERTPSRRPTRQRTPSTQRVESPSGTSPVHESSFTDQTLDKSPNGSRVSPSYQYQPFLSQSLTPLLEDASSLPTTPLPERKGRGHMVSSSDSYFTFHPERSPHSPPGLPLPAPWLKALPSPTITPFSPLVSLATPPASPSPKSQQVSVVRPVSPTQRILGVRRPLSPPVFSPRPSVPEELALEFGKAVPTSPTLTSLSMDVNGGSPTLVTERVPQPRRGGMGLMGWELRRNSGADGKRGLGLVRRGSTSA